MVYDDMIRVDNRYIFIPLTAHVKLHQMIEINHLANIIF